MSKPMLVSFRPRNNYTFVLPEKPFQLTESSVKLLKMIGAAPCVRRDAIPGKLYKYIYDLIRWDLVWRERAPHREDLFVISPNGKVVLSIIYENEGEVYKDSYQLSIERRQING